MKAILSFALLVLALTAVACGGTAAAPQTGGARVSAPGGSYTNVDSKTLNKMLTSKDFMFVNVHIPYEGEIANTDAFIPYDKIETQLNLLPKDKNAEVVLYCRSGRMSQIAAEKLVTLGYTNVWNLEGGMVGWEQAGFPLITK